jgi:hypothetical protein
LLLVDGSFPISAPANTPIRGVCHPAVAIFVVGIVAALRGTGYLDFREEEIAK